MAKPGAESKENRGPQNIGGAPKGARKQSVKIYFWKPEIIGEDDKPKTNPVQGVALAFFRAPESFSKPNEDGEVKARSACWFLLTAPTVCQDGTAKKTRVVEAGQVVWLDLGPAWTSIVQASQPNAEGTPRVWAEVRIVPSHKQQLGDGRQLWIADVYVPDAEDGELRIFATREQLLKVKVGHIPMVGMRSDFPLLDTTALDAEIAGQKSAITPPALPAASNGAGLAS